MHLCAKYGYTIMNYVMDMIINMVFYLKLINIHT
jgi:hypothetical protein